MTEPDKPAATDVEELRAMIDLLPHAEKMMLTEHIVRQKEELSAAWDNAAQVELDKLRATESDACAAAEKKVQSAEADVQLAKTNVQLAEASIQSAQEELKQAEERLILRCTELLVTRTLGSRKISAVEDEKHKQRSEADAQIKFGHGLLDKARKEEMTRDAPADGESA